MKHKIRTRKQPDVVIEVEGPEYLDLLRQGLVLPEKTPTPDPAVANGKTSASRPAAGKND